MNRVQKLVQHVRVFDSRSFTGSAKAYVSGNATKLPLLSKRSLEGTEFAGGKVLVANRGEIAIRISNGINIFSAKSGGRNHISK